MQFAESCQAFMSPFVLHAWRGLSAHRFTRRRATRPVCSVLAAAFAFSRSRLVDQPGSVRAFNRLSRFQYDPSSAENTRLSEEVILDTSDKNYVYHSAGWIGFKPSAYQSSNVSFRVERVECRMLLQ